MREKEQLKFFPFLNQGLLCLGGLEGKEIRLFKPLQGRLWKMSVTDIPVLYRLYSALFSFPYGTRVGRFVRP